MDEQQRKQLGARIEAARKERGWSQAKLAQEAGVSENTVMTLEAGSRATQASKVRAVMDVLGLETRNEGTINVEGLQEDAKIFITVAVKRLSQMQDDDKRSRVINRMYPKLLSED